MKVGITTNGGSSDICQILEEEKKKNELKQHSIYVLSDDSDTDFDFYVLVPSVENPLNNENFKNEKNGFLKELFNFLAKANDINYNDFADENHREQLKNWLGEGVKDEDLTVLNWLKIEMEKYPYRVFVAVDNPEDYKNKVSKSQFIKKRICWIGKEELNNAFSESNQNVLEIKRLDDRNEPEGNNILEKIRWQERAKLWLYYKWVEHLMNEKKIKRINVWVGMREERGGFYGITLPSRGFLEELDIVNSQNLVCGNGSKIVFLNIEKRDYYFISYVRHLDQHPIVNNPYNFQNCVYAESCSGVQFQFPLLCKISPQSFTGLRYSFLAIENALNKVSIADERFLEYFHNLSPEWKFAFLWQGIIPIDVLFNFNIIQGSGNFKLLAVNRFEIDTDYITDILNRLSRWQMEMSKQQTGDIINQVLEILKRNICTFILHQGIIDKINISHQDLLVLKDCYPFFIITSGRGKPENIPKGEKFIPFGVIESYLLKTYPEKMLLTKTIFRIIERGG